VFIKNSIRATLVIYFLLVATIPLTFFGYLGYSNARKSLIEKEEKEIKLFTRNIESKIIKFFCITKNNILFLKEITEEYLSDSDGNIDNTHKEELENIYYHFSKNNVQYDQIEFINREGYTEIGIGDNKGEIYIISDEEYRYKGYDYYFKEALKLENGEIYISDIDLNHKEGRVEEPFKPMIRYITPIYKNNGLKGFLVLGINMKYLLSDIERERTQSKYENTMLLDKNGYYLLHPDKEKEWGGIRDLNTGENFSKDYPKVTDEVFSSKTQKIKSNEKSILFWYPIELECLNNKKMIMFTELQKYDYLKRLNGFRYYFIFNVTITVLIMIISVIIISFYLTKPILNIVKAVEDIGKGHFDVSLEINTGDELELLSCQIKKMAYELKDIYKNMEEEVDKRTRELKHAHQQLKEMATKDSLTGLYNRHYFNQYIQDIDKNQRKEHKNLMILIIDVDGFKYINDNYGHNIGDIVLKEVAKILRDSSRESDLTVRYGGDEFLIALYGSGQELVKNYIDRVEKSLKEWNRENDILRHSLSVSIGYDEYSSDKHILEAINNADKMMYENKIAKRKEGQE